MDVASEGVCWRVADLVDHPWNKVAGVGDHERLWVQYFFIKFLGTELERTDIGDNCCVGDALQNSVPGAYVGDPLGQWPTRLRQHFVGVQPNFGHVVEQREKRRQRKRRHEHCHEAVLQN